MGNYFYTYDTKEQIDICLKCNKPECTNCMEYNTVGKEKKDAVC